MTEKKCCPVWTIVAVILVLAAIAVTVYFVFKKLHLLGCRFKPMDEGFWVEEDKLPAEGTDGDSGVRYTTDQDFV